MWPRWYILDGHKPVPVADMRDAVHLYADHQARCVAFTRLDADRIEVSTVFLVLDHQFDPAGPPLLFETMVFGGALDQEQTRSSTWQEAEKAHEAMLQRVKASLPN